jgi:hypothetical protein
MLTHGSVKGLWTARVNPCEPYSAGCGPTRGGPRESAADSRRAGMSGGPVEGKGGCVISGNFPGRLAVCVGHCPSHYPFVGVNFLPSHWRANVHDTKHNSFYQATGTSSASQPTRPKFACAKLTSETVSFARSLSCLVAFTPAGVSSRFGWTRKEAHAARRAFSFMQGRTLINYGVLWSDIASASASPPAPVHSMKASPAIHGHNSTFGIMVAA